MGYPHYNPYTIAWPTIEEQDGREIDRDKVEKLIGALEDDLKRLKDADKGTVSQINYHANGEAMAGHAIGAGGSNSEGYPGGRLIQRTMNKATTEFTKAYGEFLTSYEQVIAALKDTAGIAKRAEDDSTVSAQSTTQNTGSLADGGSQG